MPRVSYATFWGLLGEFDLESVSTYAPAHTLDPVSTLVPFFMWLYCFIATVILVNLLIAQMSSIYEQVHAPQSPAISRDLPRSPTITVVQPPLLRSPSSPTP